MPNPNDSPKAKRNPSVGGDPSIPAELPDANKHSSTGGGRHENYHVQGPVERQANANEGVEVGQPGSSHSEEGPAGEVSQGSTLTRAGVK